jgi:hypothetical protein
MGPLVKSAHADRLTELPRATLQQNLEYFPQRRKGRKVSTDCHFDPFGEAQGKLREKSFLDP